MGNLAFVIAATALVISTLNLEVEATLWPGETPRASARASEQNESATLSLTAVSRLLGLQVSVPGLEGTPLRSAPPLPFRLLGTLVDERVPARSLAAVEDAETRKIATWRAGEEVHLARIVAIERTRVVLTIDGVEQVLETRRTSDAPTRPAQASTGEFRITRGEIERSLTNLGELAQQVRIVPSFRDGHAEGFRIVAIGANSLFGRLGLQNGDVVSRINGVDLTDTQGALALVSQLQTSPRVVVELERNGAKFTHLYNLN